MVLRGSDVFSRAIADRGAVKKRAAPPLKSRLPDLKTPRNVTLPQGKRGRYRSGQTGRTVNPLAYAFAGSNPALPTIPSRKVRVLQRVLFWWEFPGEDYGTGMEETLVFLVFAPGASLAGKIEVTFGGSTIGVGVASYV